MSFKFRDAATAPTNQQMLAEFHTAFGHPVASKPILVHPDTAELRFDMLEEELIEYRDANEETDLVEIADAIGDIIYLAYGAAVIHGIDIDPIVRLIHESNMSKLGDNGKPVAHPYIPGKIGKGPNYAPPTDAIRAELRRQGA